MHLFDIIVPLASGPLLARRDAYLDKCALDSTVKSSLRVQPQDSATLFGLESSDVGIWSLRWWRVYPRKTVFLVARLIS